MTDTPLTRSTLFTLVSFAATGETAAFAELVERYQGVALAYAAAALGDRAAAEDAVQDALVDAWRLLPQLREPDAFPGWLRRIVFKHCDRRRRGRAADEVPLIAVGEPAAPPADADPGDADAVHAALGELAPNDREVIALFYFGDRSVASIAGFLGIDEEAAKSRLHRARQRLRDRLAPTDDGAATIARSTAFLDRVMRMLKPDELATDAPHGPWSCRGRDVWDMICAALTGDVAAIRRLLARDPDLVRAEYFYTQPIHFAVREGHLDAVRALLAAGADPTAVRYGGDDLATTARDRGHDAVAALIEQARAARARTAEADHPIHAAATGGDVAALRALLDADPALVHRADADGRLPLHRAVAADARQAVELLLDRGADLEAPLGAGGTYQDASFRPLDLALWNGPFWGTRTDTRLARRLVERGAADDLVIAAAFGDRARVERLLAEDPARIRAARATGKRPLSAAIEFGHGDIARLLLARDADPNGPEGRTAPKGCALHVAARAGDRALVELLLAHGADPNAAIDSSGSATYAAKTPELRALLTAHGGRLDCYDLIWLDEDEEVLRRVAEDPRAALDGCGTAFAAACTRGKRELVIRMLALGARVPAVVTGCRTYLWEDPALLALLLDSGMNPDLPDWSRATPLHSLCARDGRGRPMARRLETAGLLLDRGARIDARDEEYRSTPLAWAARCDLPDLVALLLRRGAAPMSPDDEPWATPLAWAQRRGHAAVIDLLRRAGATR